MHGSRRNRADRGAVFVVSHPPPRESPSFHPQGFTETTARGTLSFPDAASLESKDSSMLEIKTTLLLPKRLSLIQNNVIVRRRYRQ